MVTQVKNNSPRHRMLCDALADSICERLFGHEFAPRAPLDEAALAARYGTPRLALVAALEQLARDRLLTARTEGGYCAAGYCLADIEDILALLERIRLFMARRQALQTGSADEIVAASPYWGVAGLAVERSFTVAARSLYEQLRMGIGPELAALEAQCAKACGDDLARAVASGEIGPVEDVCAESARMFRQRILAAFDGVCARRA